MAKTKGAPSRSKKVSDGWVFEDRPVPPTSLPGDGDNDVVVEGELPKLTREQLIALCETYNEALATTPRQRLAQTAMLASLSVNISGGKGWRTRDFERGSRFTLGVARLNKRGDTLLLRLFLHDETTWHGHPGEEIDYAEIHLGKCDTTFGEGFRVAMERVLKMSLIDAMRLAAGETVPEPGAVSAIIAADDNWGDW